ncbi:hypothetical protein HHI36_005530 [Cryptolaemus montrouzieri]|uniref:Uncharacterized protein n=1 Tax=Cryptolaemus montrouzieri TaxID=559131 RepID=A0ABD2NUG8_9CUCU
MFAEFFSESYVNEQVVPDGYNILESVDIGQVSLTRVSLTRPHCALVRSILEYGSLVCSPRSIVASKSLGKIQNRFLRLIFLKQGITFEFAIMRAMLDVNLCKNDYMGPLHCRNFLNMLNSEYPTEEREPLLYFGCINPGQIMDNTFTSPDV